MTPPVNGRLLAVTGGHRYDVGAFTDLLAATCDALGWTYDHVEHPDAQSMLHPASARDYDAVLLHDLPGLRLARGSEPELVEPSESERLAIAELFDHGIGVVATHHALAGWPTWDAWATALGGRFLYAPGTLRGRATPASGYRMATYRVAPFGSHPVCEGVEPFDKGVMKDGVIYRNDHGSDDSAHGEGLLGRGASLRTHRGGNVIAQRPLRRTRAPARPEGAGDGRRWRPSAASAAWWEQVERVRSDGR